MGPVSGSTRRTTEWAKISEPASPSVRCTANGVPDFPNLAGVGSLWSRGAGTVAQYGNRVRDPAKFANAPLRKWEDFSVEGNARSHGLKPHHLDRLTQTGRVTQVQSFELGTVESLKQAVRTAPLFRYLRKQGVRIAAPNSPIPGKKQINPLLHRLRRAGKTLPIRRGEVSAQDLAAPHRATGHEMAIFRDRATGQLYLGELGPAMGDIPDNSRLIIHSHPTGTIEKITPR